MKKIRRMLNSYYSLVNDPSVGCLALGTSVLLIGLVILVVVAIVKL